MNGTRVRPYPRHQVFPENKQPPRICTREGVYRDTLHYLVSGRLHSQSRLRHQGTSNGKNVPAENLQKNDVRHHIECEKRAKEQALEQKRTGMATEVEGLMKQGKSREALDKLDKYIATDADFENMVADVRVKLLYATDEAAGYAYVRKLADGAFKDNPYALAWLAGSVVDESYKHKSPDYDLAVSVGTRAVELTRAQDAYILSQMADIYAKKGDIDKAIESLESAVKVASSDKEWPKEAVDQLKNMLQELKGKK